VYYLLVSAEDNIPANDRHGYLRIEYFGIRDLHNILIENGEIRPLADLERPFLFLFECTVGRRQRIGHQGFFTAEFLIRFKSTFRLTLEGLPGYRGVK